jgi:indolepyruvate ferredoxin oxidoreductase alpha subunit
MEIIEEKPGNTLFILGNEAITRGALEAGVDVATSYPGTPSSEIADTFSAISQFLKIKKKKPIFYFEYSINEKVALEITIAASFCGLRSLTCMKHVGLNVASDALINYLYVGSIGGHIIVTADDPFCHSSQNEQDNRYYSMFAGIPMLEPTTPQEAKEMTKTGFEISEKLQLPVLMRTTTRLSHVRGPVKLEKMIKSRGKGYFKKDPKLILHPAIARKQHLVLLQKLNEAENLSNKSSFNEIIKFGKKSNVGIVTSGVSYNYVREAVEDLKLDVSILKLGMTHPLPRQICEKFIKSCKEIIVVEELEPILENQLKSIKSDIDSNVKFYGKSTGHFSRLNEYNPDIVIEALSKIFKVKNPLSRPIKLRNRLPNRPPLLCPGCSHRATYYAAKKASPKETIYPSDIGCYGLGNASPLEMVDLILCMGSNAGTSIGFSVSTNQKIISFMGDSTFFHAGIPAIIDAVHHNHDCVITILDNQTTAMTGHQPHPGSKYDGMGKNAESINVEDVIKGIGVKHVEIVNPDNINKTISAFKRALNFRGTSVIISKSPCIILEIQNKKSLDKRKFVYFIDQEKCNQCKNCISQFGCPAFYYSQNSTINIDKNQCTSCGNCVQICPSDAIKKAKNKVNKLLDERQSNLENSKIFSSN